MLNSWLFVNTPLELAGLLLVVLIAGIVRGAIGFGFSALVVASAGFWLSPVPVICLVILLEAAASLLLYSQTQDLYTLKILATAALSLIPLLVGTTLGGFCFNYFSEDQLKRTVLFTLLTLSCLDLIKTLSN